MYVCMYVCMCVYLFVCIYVCVCMYVCMYVCINLSEILQMILFQVYVQSMYVNTFRRIIRRLTSSCGAHGNTYIHTFICFAVMVFMLLGACRDRNQIYPESIAGFAVAPAAYSSTSTQNFELPVTYPIVILYVIHAFSDRIRT